MDFHDLLLIVTGAFDLILGFLILLRNNKSQINLSFTLFSFALAGWALGIAFFDLSNGIPTAFFWAKEFYIAANFTSSSLLYFALIFPENKPLSFNKKLLVFGPSLLQAILISFPSYLTKDVLVHAWGKEVVLGRVEYLIYTLSFLPYLYSALYILWSKHKKYQGNTSRQLQLICLSVLVASIFGVVFNLFMPWFGNYHLIYLGPPFTMIIFWLLSYAIVRHQFLDVRFILARSLAYGLLLIILGIFTSASFIFVGETLFSLKFSQEQLLFFLVITPIVGFNFQLVKKTLENLTDKLFYKGYYNPDEFLAELSSTMETNIDLNNLTLTLLNTLLKNLRISKGAFILLEGEKIYTVKEIGYVQPFNLDYIKIREYLNKRDLIVFDELEEGEFKQLLRSLDVAILKVLAVKDTVVGLLILGTKASGEIYSDQDLKVLEITTPEIALAIQNAQSYDKIRKFNLTLTEEVKKATYDLQNANNRLRELDRLKDDFVSLASHELRTPMTAIRSYAWMALYRSDVPLSDKMKRYLTRTLMSTERLINLVNDMLNISRIESGRVEISPVAFDIRTLARDVTYEVEVKAQEKDLKIHVMNSEIPKVFADPDKVHQILLNLISNSMKFTPNGGEIYVSFFTDGQIVDTSVKDTGVGISKEDLPQLFGKFGRLESSYLAAGITGGTGLGLYICKNLIGLMKGKIWAESEGVNKGTKFTFSLPIATPEVLKEADKYARKVEGEALYLEPVAI